MTFAKIFYHQSGVDFIGGVNGVENIVIQHEILIVLETSDILLLSNTVDNFLIFCEHIVKHNLFAQNIDYFIVVDALRTADVNVLVESKTFLEGESDTILQVASFIEHWLSFLNENFFTSLDPRLSVY